MAVDLLRKQPQSASIGPDQTVIVMRRLAAVLGAVNADGVLEVLLHQSSPSLSSQAKSSQLKARAAGPDACFHLHLLSFQGSTTSFPGNQRGLLGCGFCREAPLI